MSAESAVYAVAIAAGDDKTSGQFEAKISDYGAVCGRANKWTNAQALMAVQYAAGGAAQQNAKDKVKLSDADLARVAQFLLDQGDKVADLTHFSDKEYDAVLAGLRARGVRWTVDVSTSDALSIVIFGTHALQGSKAKFDAS
jgi:hypothetical protein